MKLAHAETEFDIFLSQLKPIGVPLSFFTDFAKCYANVSSIAVKLHQLNYLIGKSDLKAAIRSVWEENSKAFDVLGILIAVRDSSKKKVVTQCAINTKRDEPVSIQTYFKNIEGVEAFIQETGLEKVFTDKQITNLVDYVFGVEVGLDSNARKNRSGDVMEQIIKNSFTKAGLPYMSEVNSASIPIVKEALGKDIKRFDFVIETDATTYLIEVNYYSDGGSKLNEVARSYTEIGPKINKLKGFEFVWITDGIGWLHAKNKLEEAFRVIPHIYNLSTLDGFIKSVKEGMHT